VDIHVTRRSLDVHLDTIRTAPVFFDTQAVIFVDVACGLTTPKDSAGMSATEIAAPAATPIQ
jgi:hypothetical protein